MKHLQKFEDFEQVNESISDILYTGAIILGSLFGLSLAATAVVLVKSKPMRTMFKQMFSNIPKMMKIRNKIKKSENFKNIKDLVKDFNENPTESKRSKIFDELKGVLDGDEVKELQSLISKSNAEVLKSMKEDREKKK
jgi:hypothetical protein